MNMLKTFKNLFEIFMKILENLDSLKVKELQRSSSRLSKDFEEIKTIFLSHMIKVGKYLPQKIHQVATSKRKQNYIIFSGCHWVFFPGMFL